MGVPGCLYKLPTVLDIHMGGAWLFFLRSGTSQFTQETPRAYLIPIMVWADGLNLEATAPMDSSSSGYRAGISSSPPSSMPRHNKVILQRQYREKECECFNTLRDVINELTGEELQTRQEILRKGV
ncbi:hypothetical protein OG21DRAFT_1515036 [Imleria badia]|nr:hypothetical protein OG21DRAFT_1515036 [Imleria badia]